MTENLLIRLHTCRKFRIAPLIRSESAAMPAIPSPWSLSCRKDVEGAVPWTQLTPQQGAEDSGWELCLIILDPGNVVTTDGVATGHELHDTCKSHQPSAVNTLEKLTVFQHNYTNFVSWNWLEHRRACRREKRKVQKWNTMTHTHIKWTLVQEYTIHFEYHKCQIHRCERTQQSSS